MCNACHNALETTIMITVHTQVHAPLLYDGQTLQSYASVIGFAGYGNSIEFGSYMQKSLKATKQDHCDRKYNVVHGNKVST